MQMTHATFSNLWYVGNRPVDNIVIFNADGELLRSNAKWLSATGPFGNAINRMDDIDDINLRRAVDFSRDEHFYTNVKGHTTLYLNAGKFHGYSTVDRKPSYSDEYKTTFRQTIHICARVNGGEEPVWFSIAEQGDRYEEEKSPLGILTEYVMNEFNATVAQREREHITQSQADKLIRLLPTLQALVNASGLRFK